MESQTAAADPLGLFAYRGGPSSRPRRFQGALRRLSGCRPVLHPGCPCGAPRIVGRSGSGERWLQTGHLHVGFPHCGRRECLVRPAASCCRSQVSRWRRYRVGGGAAVPSGTSRNTCIQCQCLRRRTKLQRPPQFGPSPPLEHAPRLLPALGLQKIVHVSHEQLSFRSRTCTEARGVSTWTLPTESYLKVIGILSTC